MELQQLNYFLTIAQTKNMSKAAESLFVTQSALSKSIAQLEKELNVNLFIRSGRSLELSGFGRTFYNYVESALAQLSAGTLEISQMASQPHPVISLYISLPEIFCTLVPAFRQAHPNIGIRQFLLSRKELVETLMNGKTDLAITLQPENNANIRWEKHLQEELLLLTTPNSPLTQHQHLSLYELSNESFIDIANGEMRILNEAAFAQVGLHYNVGIEVQNDYCLYKMVECGCGIALVPALDFLNKRESQTIGSVTAIRLQNPPVRNIGILLPLRHTLSEEGKLFYSFASDAFAKAQSILNNNFL